MCKRQGSLTGLASPNTDSSDDKPQEARRLGIRTKHKSKLRIGGQIATGNPSPCPLDGDTAPRPAVGSLRSQHDEIMKKVIRSLIAIAGCPLF